MFLWMFFWEGPICLAGYESMFGVSECKTPKCVGESGWNVGQLRY